MSVWHDDEGFLVDPTGDGGDSAHFYGLYTISTGYPRHLVFYYVTNDGLVMRHPTQKKHTNPLNCTRDQIMPIVAVLAKTPGHPILKKILKSRLKAFCFAQNLERDLPGSKKRLIPHFHYKDSNPIPDTFPFWKKKEMDFAHEVKFKWFDGADPLFFHYMFAMAYGAYPQYKKIFKALAKPWFILDALTYRWSDNDDQGAIFSCADILGLIPLYKKIVPNWREKMQSYFNGRGLQMLGEKVIAYAESV